MSEAAVDDSAGKFEPKNKGGKHMGVVSQQSRRHEEK